MPQRFLVRLFASTAAIALGVGAWGQAPQDPVIVSGGVSVNRQGASTIVTQTTNRGVVDWRSFSIGPQETVRFDQPGRSSVTLNRVTGSELSRIDGQLSATGQVWLANPNGVLIGPGGRVNVGGLAATTGRVDVQEFLRTGKLAIDRIPSGAGIRNDGAISIAEGGYAALAAASIKNTGVINARAGSIALGSGRAMVMDFHGDRLIQFQVTEALDQAPIDADALISADGQMVALDGQVQLSARAAKGVIDNAINLKGHVIANRARIDGGTVILGEGGAVRLSGRIEASNPQGKGGSVAVLGEAVGLMDGASIDASGAKGGGEVLVGGDWQGKGGQNAAFAYVAPTASIKADASEAGDGGKVVVWADDTTRFNGAISARGAGGGAGGQVETSGKRALDVSPAATVTVAGDGAGKPGAWLLDPTDITISASGAAPLVGGVFDPLTSSTISTATISAGLATGDVTIKTSSGTGGLGNIVFQSGTISHDGATARTLALLADRNITMSSGARIRLTGAPHNVTFNSGASGTTQSTVNGGISLTGATITTEGGAISMVGGQGGLLYARPIAGLLAGVSVTGGALDAGMGTITLRGVGHPSSTASAINGVSLSGADITAEGGITIKGFSGPVSSERGLGVWVYQTNLKAIGAGGILIEGTSQGPGQFSRGVQFQTNIDGKRIDFGTGGLTVVGVASSLGGGAGVQFESKTGLATPLLITGSGPVSITGTGGGVVVGVEPNSGISFASGSPTLQSTGGNITLKGTAGLSATDNIRVGSNALIRTIAGDLTLDGSGSPGGVAINLNGRVTTESGAISILSKGISGSNNGVRIGLGGSAGTVTATGAGGRILINGQSSGSDTGVTLDRATISAADGPVVIEADKLSVTNSAAISSGVKTVIRPNQLSRSIGVAGGAGDLQVTAATLARISGPVEIGRTTGSGLITVAANAQLRQDMELITTGGVTFLGSVNGDAAGSRSLTVSAGASTVSFGGSVGATTSLSKLTVASGVTATAGPAQFVTTGAQSYSGSVLLAGPTTFQTTNSDVSFSGSVDGTSVGQTLTATLGTGTIGFASGAGANTALGSLTVGAARIAGTIATTGAQSYGQTVATADATLRADNAPISFSGSLDGPGAVRLENGSGATSFGGAVGANTRLGSLTQVGTGQLTARDQVRTDGSQSYAGSVVVASNTNFDASSGDITFSGGLNGTTAGGQSVTLATPGGASRFPVGAGDITALASLTAGAARIAGTIATTGTQSYGGSVILSGPVTFQTTNSDVSFSNSVDGDMVGQTLTATLGTGTIGFASGAGSNTALGSLAVGAARIAGTIATTGAQSYGQTVATADATLRADNAPISFSGSLDGPGAVRLENGSGATSFGGAVGALTRLGALTQVGTGQLTARDQVRTDGSQSYAGSVVVASNTNFDASSGDITFSGGLNGTTPGGQSVTLATPGGASRLPVGAGDITALASLTAGAARIAGTIATQGTQSYGGSVLLSGPVTFQTTNSDVSFGGSVDGTALGQTLTASLGTGTIGFASGAGSNTALGSLTVGAARIAGTIATTGAQSYGQTVATADATLRADNAPISFSGSLDGPGAVRLENGTGSTSFGGAVGALTRLGALTQVGTGQLTARDQVRTDGSQSYAGSVVVASNTNFDASSGDITFSGGLNGTTPGDQSVTLATASGAARLPVGAGAITALASLTAGAARIAGTIATTGAQSYGQTVATADATLRADNAPISFSGSLDGPGAVRLENGTGETSFGGAVGALSRLGSLTQVGTGKLTARDQVRTDGSQSYAGSVVVASNTNFDASSGDITFSDGLNGTTPGDQSVTLATASGAARLPVGAGAITALASLTAGAARIAGTIATTGAQSYGQTVATADATLRADNAPISFSGSLDGPGAVRLENGTGATSFGGAVGALTRLGSLTQTGTGQLTARDQVRTVGSQSYAGSVVVASNTSFDASNGDIAFDGELNGTNPGAQSVSLSTGSTGTARLGAGAGRTTALSSLSAGAARIAGTVATTGAQSYTGSVVLAGAVQLKTNGGDVTFKEVVNGATNSASLQASTGAGTISFAKGLGTTTQLASLSAGAAAVGKTIWTVGTQEYSVIMLMEDVTLRTSDAAIKVAGAINGPGGLTLEAGAGAVSLGGAVGAGTRVASLTQTGSGPLTVTDGVYTDGAQSYAGPVILGGSTVFDALNGIIDFSAGLDGSTVGGQSARINVDGSGKARLPVGAGATTALASLSLYHGPNSTYAAAEIGGTVSTIGGQRYDAVTLLSDVTLSTNNAPIYFDYSLDGPNKLKVSAGGADVTLPPLFVTPVPIDRVGVGRVYVPSLPSFGTRPSQASVAAFGTSPSIASQPSRPSGPGSPGDTPVVAAPTPTTPSLTSSPTFGSAPSVATLASQSTIETAKPAPPLFPLPPTPPNRGEPSPSVPPQQDFVGAPPLDMNSRLIKLMRDFAPREEDEISTLDLSQGALNADTSFDRTDPARPGPTIKFTITSKPLR